MIFEHDILVLGAGMAGASIAAHYRSMPLYDCLKWSINPDTIPPGALPPCSPKSMETRSSAL
jgi:hypothetical protein